MRGGVGGREKKEKKESTDTSELIKNTKGSAFGISTSPGVLCHWANNLREIRKGQIASDTLEVLRGLCQCTFYHQSSDPVCETAGGGLLGKLNGAHGESSISRSAICDSLTWKVGVAPGG